MWGRQVYRWSDLDFEANAQGRHRRRLADPLRGHRARGTSYVERFIGVSGERQGLPQLPDGEFLPPMAMNCAERDAREAASRRRSAASAC